MLYYVPCPDEVAEGMRRVKTPESRSPVIQQEEGAAQGGTFPLIEIGRISHPSGHPAMHDMKSHAGFLPTAFDIDCLNLISSS